MASIALLTSLRDRAESLKIDTTTSPSGYSIPQAVADRIKTLKQTDQFNRELFIEELNAMFELAFGVEGQLFFEKHEPRVPLTAVKPTKAPTGPKFIPEFIDFLIDGDFSRLADPATGMMTPAMFKQTKDYIFCNVKKVVGQSCIARFYSNDLRDCSGTISEGVTVEVGPMVILRHPQGKIFDATQVGDTFVDRARAFNNLAARSKIK